MIVKYKITIKSIVRHVHYLITNEYLRQRNSDYILSTISDMIKIREELIC